ncbi:MAG: ABC transporter substrate-binding protein, partial [Lactobacillus sp.]|nr:ABC transporter substrate-binding protein [Lactobacillus sp.]
MKKTLLLLIILLGSGFWYFNQQKNVTDEGRAIVKIGATLPLTGDGSEAGQVTKEALQLMLEHLEQRGLKYDYQLIFEDNQMNPKMTATTTNKLIGSDKVKAVLSFWGVMSNVVSAIADKNQVISMSCAFGENATNGKYNFNFMPTYESQAEV